MEHRKNQFFIFSILLLIIGFLQYVRKISNGYKLNKIQKILYLITLIVFTITIMIILYFTELNNLISFCLGLVVATSSEHIAKLFLVIGNNFDSILAKILKKVTNIDFSEDLIENNNTTNNPKN
jgi:hypothetical protein